MFCTKCGCLNEDNAHFCGSCGTQLSNAQAVYQQPEYPQAASQQSVYQVQSWPAYPQWQVPQKTKLPGRALGMIGLVLSLLALVLGIIWEVSAVIALLGMAFSSLALAKAAKAGKSNSLAVGGMICGIVALVIAILIGIFSPDLFSAVPDAGMDYSVYM